MDDQQFGSAVETLIGGDADTFIVCAGSGAPVSQLTVSQVRSALNVADGAEVNRTAGEVKTAYESNANTNPFTDSEKIKIASLGTAAETDATDYATADQGLKADTATQPDDLATVATSGDYEDLTNKPSSPTTPKLYIELALSGNQADIAAGTAKGFARVHTAGTITGFVVDCDPNNEPSASSLQVDLNKLDRSTGAATTVLSSIASIAIAANTGTGTVDGTQSVSAGDLLQLDIDQGSDGYDLLATIEITPS